MELLDGIMESVMGTTISFAAQLSTLIFGMTFLAIIDTVLNMLALSKTSCEFCFLDKMKDLITVVLLYLTTLISAAVLDLIFIKPVWEASIFTNIVAFIIASTEFTSLIGHLNILLGFDLKGKILRALSRYSNSDEVKGDNK